jgi:hypothetical protein
MSPPIVDNFQAPPIPPRNNNVTPPTAKTTTNSQYQNWTQFSPPVTRTDTQPVQTTTTSVFQPAVDPFELKWRAFSFDNENPFNTESSGVNI